MKYILWIGDGMADNPVDELGGKTPLEAANKPLMDRLANAGERGSVRTVPQGVAPGSDTAILSILGCDPRRYYAGRSPFEAAGAGVDLEPGQVSYRCNMVSLGDTEGPYEEKPILSHNGGSVEGEDALALMKTLQADEAFARLRDEAGMVIHEAPGFRHIAVQGSADTAGMRLIPPHDHLGEAIGPLLPAGNADAEVLGRLMRRAHEVLNKHPVNEKRRAAGKLPANGLWFWAEGELVALPSFAEAYGKQGFVVSAVPLVRGIGRLSGLSSVEVPGATGELETNYEGKSEAAARGLLQDGKDFAVLHIEAPDECTHNGDLKGKLQAIDWLSSRSGKALLEAMEAGGEPFRILCLSDHKTLTSTRGHDGEPVPYFLYDSRRDAGGSGGYTEAACAKGPLMEDGTGLMAMLFAE